MRTQWCPAVPSKAPWRAHRPWRARRRPLAGRAAKRRLTSLISRGRRGDGHKPASVTSVCSAHPTVVGAPCAGAVDGTVVLIEATCNQSHQVATQPDAGRVPRPVYGIADRAGLPRRQVVLGGDHLGPTRGALACRGGAGGGRGHGGAYVSAGYEKIHLDTSMAAGEPCTWQTR